MKIFNIMLGRKLGGIEQAFLDYHLALSNKSCEVVNITSVGAKVNYSLDKHFTKCFTLLNLGLWDIFSKLYLWLLIILIKPDILIAHGNRAISFTKTVKGKIPLIGVAHNYNISRLLLCDYVIALTEHMKEHLIKTDFQGSNIAVIPNMINVTTELITRDYKEHVIIGVMARLVQKKGVDILIKACHKLILANYNIKLIIAGDGEEKNYLIKLVNSLQLGDHISFIGWVNNKNKFFRQIDILCIPSLHEPFGIIVLEAMAYSVPVVATDAEGPREIIEHKYDGLLAVGGSVEDLAKNIAYLISNPSEGVKYTTNAYAKVISKYSMLNVANILYNFLGNIKKRKL